jgi:hypothetical protein
MLGDRCLTLDLWPSISFAKPEEEPKNKEWGVAATMDEGQPSLGDWRYSVISSARGLPISARLGSGASTEQPTTAYSTD